MVTYGRVDRGGPVGVAGDSRRVRARSRSGVRQDARLPHESRTIEKWGPRVMIPKKGWRVRAVRLTKAYGNCAGVGAAASISVGWPYISAMWGCVAH